MNILATQNVRVNDYPYDSVQFWEILNRQNVIRPTPYWKQERDPEPPAEHPPEPVPLHMPEPRRILSDLSAAELREWVNSLKHQCIGCGEPDSTVLVYHHVDRTKKHMGISTMAGRRYTKPEILEEMDKCVVLCCNCHTRIHA